MSENPIDHGPDPSKRERCGHEPPIPWRYSSCIGCVFNQIEEFERHQAEDAKAIRALWHAAKIVHDHHCPTCWDCLALVLMALTDHSVAIQRAREQT